MTTLTNSQSYAIAAANRGASLLDDRRPGWFNEVSTERLDMADGEACILGQLYPHYVNGTKDVFAGQGDEQRSRQAVEFGFNHVFLTFGSFDRYEPTNAVDLGNAWREIINARRNPQDFLPVEPVKSGNQFMVSWHGGDEPSFFLTDNAAEGYGKFAEWLGLADLNDCLSIVTIFEGVILETVTRFGE